MNDDEEKEEEDEGEDRQIGTIHIDGKEVPFFKVDFVPCGECYWVSGHTVYTLEDGTEIMDFDTDEGSQG